MKSSYRFYKLHKVCFPEPNDLTYQFLYFSGDSWGVGHNHWFLFVVVTSFIVTLLWSFFYFLQIKNSIHMTLPFSWLKLVSYCF